MRGFIGGALIGLVTVAIAVVVLSLLSPASQSPDVTDGAPVSATSSPTDANADANVEAGADADLAEMAPTAPGAIQNQNDTLSALEEGDTTPGDKPRVGGATTGLAEPGSAPQAPDVARISDAPQNAPAPSVVPGAPQDESQPSALANPAQPTVPDVSGTGSGFGTAPVVDETAPQIATSADTSPASEGAGPVTQTPGAGATPELSTQSAPAPVIQPAPQPGVAQPLDTALNGPQVDDAPQVLPQTDLLTDPQTGPQTGAAPVPDLDQAAPKEPNPPAPVSETSGPQIAALPQAGAGGSDPRPQIGKKVVPLTERNKAAEAAAETPPAAEAGPAIEVYAEPFENPENRPMMAIVLIDDDQALGVEALADFPYPLTFAVDPSAPDAAAKMARHRAAGFEVVALVDLPGQATAQDAEVSLSVWLDTLPQVVGLIEGTESGIQGNRALSDQVTAIAASAGLGLIMQSKGLNTAQKLAARDGVPSAVVFRDFDGAGQTARVIRRFLDQAAFRAGQQGGVVMMGRVRPDTISALLVWGLQDRASRLALVPVSAVLGREAAAQ
jgi:uncharacterized protein